MTCRGKYNGEWVNDKKHGYGTSIYSQGQIYDGKWSEGLWHGQGKLTKYKEGNEKKDGSPEEEVIEGEWVHGKFGDAIQS